MDYPIHKCILLKVNFAETDNLALKFDLQKYGFCSIIINERI